MITFDRFGKAEAKGHGASLHVSELPYQFYSTTDAEGTIKIIVQGKNKAIVQSLYDILYLKDVPRNDNIYITTMSQNTLEICLILSSYKNESI